MKIGIIGLGVVGSAVEYGMKRIGHKVFVHDTKLKTTIFVIYAFQHQHQMMEVVMFQL